MALTQFVPCGGVEVHGSAPTEPQAATFEPSPTRRTLLLSFEHSTCCTDHIGANRRRHRYLVGTRCQFPEPVEDNVQVVCVGFWVWTQRLPSRLRNTRAAPEASRPESGDRCRRRQPVENLTRLAESRQSRAAARRDHGRRVTRTRCARPPRTRFTGHHCGSRQRSACRQARRAP